MTIKIRKLEEEIKNIKDYVDKLESLIDKSKSTLESKKRELQQLKQLQSKPKKSKSKPLKLTTVKQAIEAYPEVFGGPESLDNYKYMFLGRDDEGVLDEQYIENYDIEDADNILFEKQMEILIDLITDTEIQGMVWRMKYPDWKREDAPEMSSKVLKYFIECVFGDEADKIYKRIK